MSWMKAAKGDKWLLFSAPGADGTRRALGCVERVGLRYEARDAQGIVISNGCVRQHAMRSVEKSAMG